VVEGELCGRITESQAGRGGFGYDPVFYVPEVGKTLAELTAEEKNRISHRRRALDKARTIILEN
jgi:XTP/dITP diphosphohydrolase